MIIVDVETTGVNPQKHSIISIGAVDFYNPKNQFYQECKAWEGAEFVREALAVNGFSEAEILHSDRQSLKETIVAFLKWAENISNKTIAGQNPSFDRDFLKAAAEKYDIRWPLGIRSIDLHSVCYAFHLRKKLCLPIHNGRTDLNTNNILNFAGLPDEPTPHNALVGAKMEAEALSRVILGKSLLEEYKHYSVPDYLCAHKK